MLFVATSIVFLLTNYMSTCVHSADDVTKCNINDPDVSSCVMKALNSLRPQSEREGKQIKSSTYDPFVIPMFHVSQESTLANYSGSAINYTIRGLDSFDIKYIKFDPATMTFHGRVEYDPLAINSNYESEGNLLSITIKGKGAFHAAIGPINATVDVNGKILNNNGIKSYKPTGLKIRMVIDDGSLYMDGLFGQNPDLDRITNEALNANPNLLVAVLTPALENIAERVFLKSIKSISKNVLYVE